MDLSGIIFVLLAAVWAVFLIPKALRHSDEAARTRSIDRFSPATRVLARREPVTGKDARLVVTPPSARSVAGAGVAAGEPATRARVATRRTAARAAARRRRWILAFLLLCTIGVVAAAAMGRLPWHWVAVPGGATLAFLMLCRVLVRRSRRRAARKRPGRPTHAPAEPDAPREPVAVGPETAAAADPLVAPAVDEPGVAQFDDAEDTMGLSVAALQAALDSPSLDSPSLPEPVTGTLWDPLPVTLPTYVTKPKARRTVRTIDLGEPGTWTSGRTVEDAEIAARATQAPDGETGAEGDQRAVGS